MQPLAIFYTISSAPSRAQRIRNLADLPQNVKLPMQEFPQTLWIKEAELIMFINPLMMEAF